MYIHNYLSYTYIILINLHFTFLETIPIELYLNSLFIKSYATQWRDIGLVLGMNDTVLDVIATDHPNSVWDCCKVMLSRWLQKDAAASWEQLFCAVDIANDDSGYRFSRYVA